MRREIAQFWGGGAEIGGCSFMGLKAVDFAHAGESTADVGNGDGATDDEGDVEGVNDFFSGPAFFRAANEMVSDAVVAAENGGRDGGLATPWSWWRGGRVHRPGGQARRSA